MWFEVEEFIYDEASSSDESDEDDVGFEDATQSEFVLHRFTDNKYYAAVVFENTANHEVLRCAKKLEYKVTALLLFGRAENIT